MVARRRKKTEGLVTGSGNPDHKVNQHAPIFYDRRTKKNRDRSSQNRNAIRDSKDY